jgi:hypothetical protein
VSDEVLITEDWLKSIGFRWHQLDRQPSKHWLLWVGGLQRHMSFADTEDLGVEVSAANDGWWHCWFRSDESGRYHRFIHVRYLRTQRDLICLLEAVTGQEFDPRNHFNGCVRTPEQAAAIRRDFDRLDRRIRREGRPWRDIEKDPSMGGALPEHLDAHEKAKAADGG